ncbi:MAG: hypothetical protein FWD31_07800, partial [Planctomycetaceae bacterium]|nr:hypothetical protein [Planctomycetaceae bacterium]
MAREQSRFVANHGGLPSEELRHFAGGSVAFPSTLRAERERFNADGRQERERSQSRRAYNSSRRRDHSVLKTWQRKCNIASAFSGLQNMPLL